MWTGLQIPSSAASKIIFSNHGKTKRRFNPSHRLRPNRYWTGLRVRLFRHTSLQNFEGRGLSRDFGELQSGDDHDRSRYSRRHLHRTDHARNCRKNYRQRKTGRNFANRRRTDCTQLRLGFARKRNLKKIRREDDWRGSRGHRES